MTGSKSDAELKQAQELLNYSNRLISDAISECGMDTFSAVPLDIPAYISPNNPTSIQQPDSGDYFAIAESLWDSLIDQPSTSDEQEPQEMPNSSFPLEDCE